MRRRWIILCLVYAGMANPLPACQTCVIDQVRMAYPALEFSAFILVVWAVAYAIFRRDTILESPKRLIIPCVILFILTCMCIQAGLFIFLAGLFAWRLYLDLLKPAMMRKSPRLALLIIHIVTAILIILASAIMYNYYYSLSVWQRYDKFVSWGTSIERRVAGDLARDENFSLDTIQEWLRSSEEDLNKKAAYVLSLRRNKSDAIALEKTLMNIPDENYGTGWSAAYSPYFREWLDDIGAPDVTSSATLMQWIDEQTTATPTDHEYEL